MIRPRVGDKFQNNADKSQFIEVLEVSDDDDWTASVRLWDGTETTLNAASLGHRWTKVP